MEFHYEIELWITYETLVSFIIIWSNRLYDFNKNSCFSDQSLWFKKIINIIWEIIAIIRFQNAFAKKIEIHNNVFQLQWKFQKMLMGIIWYIILYLSIIIIL